MKWEATVANDRRDDELGYGKPPKWARFEKGRSGNPRGRPKKKAAAESDLTSCDVDDIYRRELARKIRVNVSGGAKELAALEVVTISQIQTAAKGSPHAQRDVLKAAAELARRDAERRRLEEEERRQIFSNVVEWKKIRARDWAATTLAGGEPDELWPHPDDMLIDLHAMTWSVRGPIDESDVPRFEHYRAERDMCFAKAMIDIRKQRVVACGTPSIWDPMWMYWDALLPLRWQLLPQRDLHELSFLSTPMRKLRALEEACAAEVEGLRRRAAYDPQDKDAYRFANTVMKPLLKRQGYRSLAEFECTFEETGGNPPWPKSAKCD